MQKYIKSEELKEKFHPDLQRIYEIKPQSLVSDIKERGILSPVQLSIDGWLLEGYTRAEAALELGINEVPYIETNLEATKENRVALNLVREKTWKDERSELLILFDTFGNQQGKKYPAGYNRYDEIRKRFNGRYKDDKSLRLVENLLRNDVENHPLAYWLIEKKSDLTSLEAVLRFMQNGEHPEIVSQVLEMKLDPKTAQKKIKRNKNQFDLSHRAFKMPQSTKESCIVTYQNKEEILLELRKDKAMMLFYEPYSCTSNFDTKYSSITDHKRLVSVYSTKVAADIKPFVEQRLHPDGSLFISVREFYSNGIARQLPAEVIRSIEAETNLIYKQTFICTDSDSFTKVSRGNQVPDVFSHLLWFVKASSTKMRGSIFEILKNANLGQDAPAVYAQCANYLNRQTMPGMIQNLREKDSLLDPVSLVTLFLSTEENDLVVDLSMKGDLVTAAPLMNRRFIGLQSYGDKLKKSDEQLTETLELFKEEYAEQLTQSLGIMRSDLKVEDSQFEVA